MNMISTPRSLPLPDFRIHRGHFDPLWRFGCKGGCQFTLSFNLSAGVFSGDPSQPESKLLPLVTPSMMQSGEIKFGAKSTSGRGGMESKVISALYAAPDPAGARHPRQGALYGGEKENGPRR
jgi:hypothetical protein